MLNQPYSGVSTISQQASCVLHVILQGVFEHPSIVDFLHEQCDLKCKETLPIAQKCKPVPCSLTLKCGLLLASCGL